MTQQNLNAQKEYDAIQREYKDKTCGGMRPMTTIERLEKKRDEMITDLQEINYLINVIKTYPIDNQVFDQIKKFY